MRLRTCIAVILLLAASFTSAETLRVGVKSAPPFAQLDDSGKWSGISVALWQSIAKQLNWQTEWVVMDSPRAQIDGLAAGKIDVAVGALSMTSEREELIDFSHPFYSTGLTIATPAHEESWIQLLGQLLSPAFLSAVGILVLMLLTAGVLMWTLERKRNPEQFGGTPSEGIGNGFWWSAVTMTTVGYGDKAPLTFSGRVLATIWMFFSVITISGFTAAIASSLAINQLSTVVAGVDDLQRVRTLVVEGSTGERFLHRNGYRSSAVANSTAGLEQLREGTAGALVQDEALLRYLLKDSPPGIEILPLTIEQQDYAFGLKPGFEQREALNRALLALTHSNEWRETLNQYLGKH